MLVIFGGLPATGKTAIARELARQIGGVHLRIDSIEQAIRAFGMASPVASELPTIHPGSAHPMLRTAQAIITLMQGPHPGARLDPL